MDTNALQLFASVVARGTFTAAADAAGLDPSAVSRAVAGLERQLGFRLFERSTRRIALTEAGAAYHARIAPILSDLDAAATVARDLVDTPSGMLRVSASTAFGEAVIVPMLAAFRAENPGVAIALRLSDAQVDLIGEGIDVAVRMTPDAPQDMVTRKLMTTRYRVVASHEWSALHALKTPRDLSDHACLVFPYSGFRDLWRFRDASGNVTDVPVQRGIEITGAMAMAAAARAGLGPALLADWLIGGDVAAGRLVDLLPDHDAAGGSFDTGAYILMPSRAYLPLKTRRFVDALRRHIAAEPTG